MTIPAIAVLAAALGTTQVAAAGVGPAEPRPGTQRHCVAELSAVSSDSTAVSTVRSFRCFDSLAESLRFATGALGPEPGERPDSGKQFGTPNSEVESSGGTLLGIEYEDSDYGGASLAFTGSGSGCYAGATYRFPKMGTYGFGNTISSARLYNNCFATHYAHPHYWGDRHTCYSDCAGLGDLNDRTSSIEFW